MNKDYVMLPNGAHVRAIDYHVAIAAGRDAANRRATKQGRDYWDNDDKLAAVAAFDAVIAAQPTLE